MRKFELFWMIKQVGTAFDRAELPMLQELELSPTEAMLLVSIEDLGREYCYATELHAALGLSRPAVSSTVKRLRVKGFIAYQEDDSDDRKKRIFLLPRARAALPGLRRELSQWRAALTAGISPEEEAIALDLLRKMRSGL